MKSHEFGIHTTNPELLRERYRISEGITLLDPLQAERAGYNRPEPGVGVITPVVDVADPLSSLRVPTDQEIEAIRATPDTKRVMQLVRLPKAAGMFMLGLCTATQELGLQASPETPKHQLMPGIIGAPLDMRLDAPNQQNTTVNPTLINRFTGLPPKVGDHVDGYADPDVTLMAVNMGPGARWHRITPGLNRNIAGEKRVDRFRFMQEYPDPQNLPVHWLRLAPPTEEHVEAILNSPVSWALHEGSTLGSPESSKAFFCLTEPVTLGTHPSVI